MMDKDCQIILSYCTNNTRKPDASAERAKCC